MTGWCLEGANYKLQKQNGGSRLVFKGCTFCVLYNCIYIYTYFSTENLIFSTTLFVVPFDWKIATKANETIISSGEHVFLLTWRPLESQVSRDQNLCWLSYIGDYITLLFGDNYKGYKQDPYVKQSVFHDLPSMSCFFLLLTLLRCFLLFFLEWRRGVWSLRGSDTLQSRCVCVCVCFLTEKEKKGVLNPFIFSPKSKDVFFK